MTDFLCCQSHLKCCDWTESCLLMWKIKTVIFVHHCADKETEKKTSEILQCCNILFTQLKNGLQVTVDERRRLRIFNPSRHLTRCHYLNLISFHCHCSFNKFFRIFFFHHRLNYGQKLVTTRRRQVIVLFSSFTFENKWEINLVYK